MSETVKFMFNEATELTVYGWIRKTNTKIKLNIPCVIQNLVGSYFRTYDQFMHPEYGQCSIDQNGMRVSTSPLRPNGNCSLDGEIKIKSNQFIEWKFKIIKFGNKTDSSSNTHVMSFGVRLHSEHSHSNEQHQYGVWNVKNIQTQGQWQDGKWINKQHYHRGEVEGCYSQDIRIDEEWVCNQKSDDRVIWKQGDTLTMQYDHGKLRYQVNNKQPHLIFNIPSKFEPLKLEAKISSDSKVKMTQFFIK